MEADQLQRVIENGFRELRAELDEKFGKVDARLDRVDARFDQVDARFERLEDEVGGIRREVKEAGDRAHLAHVAIEGLRHDLGIFNEAGSDGRLERRVSALEVRVTTLERKTGKR